MPAGFEIETYADGLVEPVALAQAPNGRLFVAERAGAVKIVEEGALRATPFARLEVFTEDECGLLGMALDPDFASNGHLFLFATVTFDEQRIMRLTDLDGVGQDLKVIRDQLPTTGTVHNGGCLRFGPDKKLYFSIGDNGNSANSREMHTLAGKLCRVNVDGSPPDDNPFVTPTGTPRAVFAVGFRNPFRFCFAPDGRLFSGDLGTSGEIRREEINLVVPGADYGWPIVEGKAVDGRGAEFVDPIAAYQEESGGITGLAYYDGEQFPSAYQGNLFHLDFVSNSVFRVVLSGDTVISRELFYRGDGGLVDLLVAIDGSLLFTEFFSGRVRRISYKRGPNDEGEPDASPIEDLAGNGVPADDDSDAVPTPVLCGGGAASISSTIFLILPLLLLRSHTALRVRRRRV